MFFNFTFPVNCYPSVQMAKFDYSVYQKCATMNKPYRIHKLLLFAGRKRGRCVWFGGLRGNRTEVRENVIKLDLSRL
jgi:hypothetical protein